MSKQTKIVVIKSKDLLYKIIFFIVAIIFICLVLHIISCSKSKNTDSYTYNKATNTNSIETMYEVTPGQYSSTINFAGTPLDISVTITDNETANITVNNLDESLKAMYPLLQPTIEEINEQLNAGIPIEEITFSNDNQYTSIIILDAIKDILNSKE